MQIHHGRGVRVVPSRTRRLGHELIAPPAVGRDRRGAFFLRPIYFRRNEQAMPMHVLRNVCVVHNVDGDGLALAHPQEGTGDFIVVADCADHNLRGQLDHHGRDLQGEIRRTPSVGASVPTAPSDAVAAPEPAGGLATPQTRAAACLPRSRSWWPIQAVQNPFASRDPHPGCECHHTDECLNEQCRYKNSPDRFHIQAVPSSCG